MSKRISQKKKETPVSELLDKIFEETVRVSKLTWDERQAELPPGQFMPYFIVVDGGTIPTSYKAAQLIKQLSDQLKKGEYSFTSDPDQFFRDASGAIGELLVELHGSQQSEDGWLARAAVRFEELLKARLARGRRRLMEVVPCHVFDEDQEATAFSVGPVKFSPRMEWLASQPSNKRMDYVRDVWLNRMSLEDLSSLDKTAQGEEKFVLIDASTIIRHIGNRPWVATVTLQTYDPVQGHANGRLMVELALNFLSLFMGPTNGQRLIHPGIAGPLSQTDLCFDTDGRMYSGWKFNKPGVGAPPGTANQLLTSRADIIADAGEVLTAYVSGAEKGQIPPLVERWVGALHWYGMALRDQNQFAALCDYGDVIDVLTKSGGDTDRMFEYLAAVLDVKESDKSEDYAMLKATIVRVYSDGRSQLRHGEKIGLMRDFTSALVEGNYLARISLLAAVRPLADMIRSSHRALSLDPSHARRAFLAFINAQNDVQRENRGANSN